MNGSLKNTPEDRGSFTVNSFGIAAEQPVVMLRLRDTVVFPYSLASVTLDDADNVAALQYALSGGSRMMAVFYELPDQEEFAAFGLNAPQNVFKDRNCHRSIIGTLVRVIKDIRMPDNSRRVVLRGLKRIIRITETTPADSQVTMVRYQQHITSDGEERLPAILGRQEALKNMFMEFSALHPTMPEELQNTIMNSRIPSRTADHLGDGMGFAPAEKFLLLTIPALAERMDYLTVLLNRELEVAKLGMKIHAEVQEAMGESQREFFLREQLKSIKNELGELGSGNDVAVLTRRLEESDLPEYVAETVAKELARLEVIPQNAPEYHISYNYISWMLDIPWHQESEDILDRSRAKAVLEADHFGLEEVKKRILEFLAVMQLKQGGEGDNRAPILCLVGPPGVGKTSLGRSIAEAMGRNFIRMSLGGMRDEAEIRGHRRTYVGAMPGRIVQNLKRAGTINPVFMLDEVDKLAHDFRGDPASALLEVLDPEQNNSFNDNFVELALDLSKVFFIATANVIEDIPGPLRDRMEVINIPGYTALEKREIARRYLVKRQIEANGLAGKNVNFTVSALDEIIDGYTREAGVRELDRVIARVCRRIAGNCLENCYPEDKAIRVSAKMVRELLGARKYIKDSAAAKPVPGCAVGMAWTGVGGVTLPVETVALSGGKGELKLTGSLGKVMQESAAAAMTVVRCRAGKSGIKNEFFSTHDIHIHVPDGATPKDGPSAGITMTLALSSLLLNKPLVKNLAMTGEITLSGRVTAIGGLREKLVGALTAGIEKILIPEENLKDLEDIPVYVKEKLAIAAVGSVDEALAYGFGKKEFPPPGNRI